MRHDVVPARVTRVLVPLCLLLVFVAPVWATVAQAQSRVAEIQTSVGRATHFTEGTPGVHDTATSRRDSATSHRVEPYSSIGIRLSALRAMSLGRLGNYYRADPGRIVEVETPFDRGFVGVVFGQMTMQRTSDATIDGFRVQIVGIDRRTSSIGVGLLRAAVGTRLSTFRMTFHDATKSAGLRNEEELSIGLTGCVTARATSFLAVAVSSSYSHVFLHVPEYFSTLEVGVELTHRLPKNIQNILK